jgi:aspartate carbamoyltransferase catalytic subunit
MARTWTRRHLLDLQSLSAEEILIVLDAAREFKGVGERDIKKVPALRGKTVVNLFVENSTRTRISFELAALRLSADVINFDANVSSLKKGETLKDSETQRKWCASFSRTVFPGSHRQCRRRLP